MREPDERTLDARLRAANTALDATIAASVDVEAALARVKRNAARRALVPSPSTYRAIVAIDVMDFSRRTDVHQSIVHRSLYATLEQAFNEAGIPWQECDTTHDRGDAVLVLVPSSVAHVRLVDGFPDRLAASLRRYNAIHAADARIRLRMAVHAGEVANDDRGISGHAVNHACRMLDSPVLRAVLSASPDTFALMVSDAFYREIVQPEPAARPKEYREVFVSAKEGSDASAWIRLPADLAMPAVEPAQALARFRSQRSKLAAMRRPQRYGRTVVGRVVPGRSTDSPPPSQLPADIGDFVGRTAELDQLDRLIDGDTRVAVITGPAGIGKTALAVHWAHQQAEEFPDGQLFVDLHGSDQDQPPTLQSAALRQLLGSLGVQAQRIPPDLDEQTRLYRSVMAEKRVLIVLDNAGNADHVRRLLPARPGSLAVVTSRISLSKLITLDGVSPISLAPR